MRDPFIDSGPLSFTDFQIDLKSFFNNNLETVIKREIEKNRRNGSNMKNKPLIRTTSAQQMKSHPRDIISNNNVEHKIRPVSRQQVDSGSYVAVDMKKEIGKNMKKKELKIIRLAASRRESLISSTPSQSLYEWYKYLKQSGRFNLSD